MAIMIILAMAVPGMNSIVQMVKELCIASKGSSRLILSLVRLIIDWVKSFSAQIKRKHSSILFNISIWILRITQRLPWLVKYIINWTKINRLLPISQNAFSIIKKTKELCMVWPMFMRVEVISKKLFNVLKNA